MKRTLGLAFTPLLALAATATAAAEPTVSSAYTPLDLDNCHIVKRFAEEGGSQWSCQGFGDLKVRVSEGDLRYFVSFGPRADEQRAARQTLAPFNKIHNMLEWRIEERDGHRRPIATILRYFWEMDGKKGETLVVSKLGRADACHVAYIRADGDPQANALARSVADARTDGFDCAKDEPERIDNAAFVGSIRR